MVRECSRLTGVLLVVALTVAGLAGPASPASVMKHFEKELTELVARAKDSMVKITAPQVAWVRTPLDSMGNWIVPPVVSGDSHDVLVGCGVIYDREGYVLTTTSVVGSAETVRAEVFNGEVYQGVVLGKDPVTGLALIRLQGYESSAQPLEVGLSLEVGSLVVVLGNSYGMAPSVAMGLLNGQPGPTGVGGKEGFVLLSVVANPGDSGGAVLDSDGRLVGIVSATVSSGGGMVAASSGGGSFQLWSSMTQGMATLAVPAHVALAVADDIVSEGRVVRGFLGARLNSYEEVRYHGDHRTVSRKVLVDWLVPNGPAQQGGLEVGDQILRFDGEGIRDLMHLKQLVSSGAPGYEAVVVVSRGEQLLNLPVELGDLRVRRDTLKETEEERLSQDQIEEALRDALRSASRRMLELKREIRELQTALQEVESGKSE